LLLLYGKLALSVQEGEEEEEEEEREMLSLFTPLLRDHKRERERERGERDTFRALDIHLHNGVNITLDYFWVMLA
jgi:hypothetical protein